MSYNTNPFLSDVHPDAAPAIPTTAEIICFPNKLAWALEMARRNFAVFPLRENTRVPLAGSDGHLGATTDPDLIRELWTDPMTGAIRNYNIGVCPSNGRVVIIDLDVKEGRDGINAYLALGGEIAGMVVRTTTGGLHIFCLGDDLRTGAGRLAPGIDTRTVDGYVVGPGSTIDGVAYELILDEPMRPVPQFVIDKIGTRAARAARMVTTTRIASDLPHNVARAIDIAKKAESAVSGCWHDYGFRLGCEMCRVGLSPEMTVEILHEHWASRGTGFKSYEKFVQDVLGGYHDALPQHGIHSVDAQCEAFKGLVVVPPPDETNDKADKSPVSRRKLLTPTECAESSSREYVIKGVLARGDVGLVIGPPGAGKSSVVPMMAYNLALGRPVFGRRTRQGGVLYLAAEDEHGMRGRVSALKKRLGDAAPYFHLIVGVKDLYNASSGDADWLTALAHEQRPALVIIDTLAAAFPGLRENESDEMNRVVVLARKLTLGADGEPGPAVLICVHPSKSDPTTARGHTSLPGDADVTMILIKDAETDIVDIAFGKNRNGPCYGQNMAFRIESEAVGVDCDGDTITVPVGVEVDPADLIRTEALSPTEKHGLAILQDLVDARGPDVIADIAATMEGVVLPGMSGVSETAWRDACEARDLSPAKQKASRTRLFSRTKQNLLRKGAVKALHGTFWVAEAA